MISAAVKTSIKRIAIHHFWRSRRSRIAMSAITWVDLMVLPVWQRSRRNFSNVLQLHVFSKLVVHGCPARCDRTTSTSASESMTRGSTMAHGPFRP